MLNRFYYCSANDGISNGLCGTNLIMPLHSMRERLNVLFSNSCQPRNPLQKYAFFSLKRLHHTDCYQQMECTFAASIRYWWCVWFKRRALFKKMLVRSDVRCFFFIYETSRLRVSRQFFRLKRASSFDQYTLFCVIILHCIVHNTYIWFLNGEFFF